MPRSVLPYRLLRLRRLIAVAVALPVLVVLAIAALKGPAALVLMALAIGVPVAHVLRYPNAWMETLSLSLVLSILLALAGTIGPEVGLIGLAVRLLGLGALGFGLFLVVMSSHTALLYAGPGTPLVCRARRRSRLDPAALKAAITLYPGRADAMTVCGAADEDGAFPVTITRKMEASCGGETDLSLELFAQVLSSTPDSHEVMTVRATWDAEDPELADLSEEDRAALDAVLETFQEHGAPEISLTRHQFAATATGCIVEIAERGISLTRGQAFGFWLQDFMADHLTDEVDRAEGRPPRANRSADQGQLIVDIARLFAPAPDVCAPGD